MSIKEKIQQKIQSTLKYWPLFCLVAIAALASTALWENKTQATLPWMQTFMGILFTLFAMLKLFNLKGFAEGFAKYDLLGSKSNLYSLFYPFIELSLGLGYLSGFILPVLCIVTVLLSIIGSIGVIQALKKGLDVRCACLGTNLNVPLSTVTLTEDMGMGIMALLLLF
jgi:hypothetical protein